MREFRHGALTVLEEAHDKEWAQVELRKLDDRLFLEKQLGFDQRPVWCVVCQIGGDRPPITIMEWRDEDSGEPIYELTSGLVARVARMERDSSRLMAHVMRTNSEKIERQRQQAQDSYRAYSDEHIDAILGRKSPAFHRGQGLRMARDRARGRGENV